MESPYSLPTYQYQPLKSSDSIRLLRLEPATSNNDRLRGTLVDRSLSILEDDLNTHYAALSYVWGDPTRTKSIELVNRDERWRHGLTTNLFEALINIREQHRAILIWADAICIDQHNDAERGHQIKLMGEIYRDAGCTVIYLGHMSPDIKRLFDATQQPVAGHTGTLELAATELCSHDWFGRGWIFQEMILSHNLRVQCENHRVGWKQLYSTVVQDLPTTSPGDMVRMMDKARNNHESRTFSQLVIARKGARVSDARDYFFCLMGIASDAAAVQETLPIDYSQTAKEVFTKAAHYMATDLGLRAVIAHVDSDTSKFGLPSFVPTWGVPSLEIMSNYPRPLPVTPSPGNIDVTESSIVGYETGEVAILEHVSDTMPHDNQFVASFLKNFNSWLYEPPVFDHDEGGITTIYQIEHNFMMTLWQQGEDPTLGAMDPAREFASFWRWMDFGDPRLVFGCSFPSELHMMPEQLEPGETVRDHCWRGIVSVIMKTAYEVAEINPKASYDRTLGYRWAKSQNTIARVPINAAPGDWVVSSPGDAIRRGHCDQYVFRPSRGEWFVLDDNSFVRCIHRNHDPDSKWETQRMESESDTDGGQGLLPRYKAAYVPDCYGEVIGLAKVFTGPKYKDPTDGRVSVRLVPT